MLSALLMLNSKPNRKTISITRKKKKKNHDKMKLLHNILSASAKLIQLLKVVFYFILKTESSNDLSLFHCYVNWIFLTIKLQLFVFFSLKVIWVTSML